MSVPIFIVDAFTTGNNDPYTGNPAAVCILEFDNDIPDEEKQKIAMEMNLSETAFVSEGWIRGEPKLVSDRTMMRRTLRWFTPTNEVRLCGHATVASSKCLFEKSPANEIEFLSKFKGTLGSILDRDTSLITLNFPANPTEKFDRDTNPWIGNMIQATLGTSAGHNHVVKDVQFSTTTKIVLIRLKDTLGEAALLKISPNFSRMMEIEHEDTMRDIIVTVKGEGNGKPDFYSRFFAPWDGVNEDPVCGLAHTVLTPYWVRELAKEMGIDGGTPTTLLARQSSSRGGDLHCLLQGDRVGLSGNARITLKGELLK